MSAEMIDVGVGQALRLVRKLARKSDGSSLGGREFRPVTVQCCDLIFCQARDRELDFLVAQSVMAVIDARNDPE
jgi:hypothetical protein